MDEKANNNEQIKAISTQLKQKFIRIDSLSQDIESDSLLAIENIAIFKYIEKEKDVIMNFIDKLDVKDLRVCKSTDNMVCAISWNPRYLCSMKYFSSIALFRKQNNEVGYFAFLDSTSDKSQSLIFNEYETMRYWMDSIYTFTTKTKTFYLFDGWSKDQGSTDNFCIFALSIDNNGLSYQHIFPNKNNFLYYEFNCNDLSNKTKIPIFKLSNKNKIIKVPIIDEDCTFKNKYETYIFDNNLMKFIKQ